jgi:hypothetical protein
MKAQIKNIGGKAVIVIEMELTNPTPSTSGKTLVVGTTHGFRNFGVELDGKQISGSVNLTIPTR